MTVGDFHPDLTVILDIDPQKGLARSLKRNGSAAEQEIRFESRELAFHENLRRGFLEIAESAPRYAVLDADKSVDELHREIGLMELDRLGCDIKSSFAASVIEPTSATFKIYFSC